MDTGWHPDPTGRYEHRYADNGAWTDHVATNGETHTDPYDQAASDAPDDPGPPDSTDDPSSGPVVPAPGLSTTYDGTSAVWVSEPTEIDVASPRPSPNPSTGVVRLGTTMNKATLKSLEESSYDGEPWFVLTAGTGGTLAAWDDRLVIIKAGNMTGLMAGATFGGRSATFLFVDITGIEYNSGLLNGVLEVLTPSYSGAGNRDFWRGSLDSRNSNGNDPFTSANTLPLHKKLYQQALPQLNELRQRIAAAKVSPAVPAAAWAPAAVSTPAPADPAPTPAPAPSVVTTSSPSLADELRSLADLHAAGALTDDEFTNAKQRLISGPPA